MLATWAWWGMLIGALKTGFYALAMQGLGHFTVSTVM
jgi:hypothetical protein